MRIHFLAWFAIASAVAGVRSLSSVTRHRAHRAAYSSAPRTAVVATWWLCLAATPYARKDAKVGGGAGHLSASQSVARSVRRGCRYGHSVSMWAMESRRCFPARCPAHIKHADVLLCFIAWPHGNAPDARSYAKLRTVDVHGAVLMVWKQCANGTFRAFSAAAVSTADSHIAVVSDSIARMCRCRILDSTVCGAIMVVLVRLAKNVRSVGPVSQCTGPVRSVAGHSPSTVAWMAATAV